MPETIDLGQRLYLRPVSLLDVTEQYIDWMNDPEVNQFMETRFRPQRGSDIEAYVKRMTDDPDTHFFAIVLREGNRHVGNAKLQVSPNHLRGEVSLWIGDKRLWGKGLGFETIECIKAFAFEKLSLRKLTAGCYANNEGSAKAFMKAGFFKEAVLKDHHMCQGQIVDGLRFSCFHP